MDYRRKMLDELAQNYEALKEVSAIKEGFYSYETFLAKFGIKAIRKPNLKYARKVVLTLLGRVTGEDLEDYLTDTIGFIDSARRLDDQDLRRREKLKAEQSLENFLASVKRDIFLPRVRKPSIVDVKLRETWRSLLKIGGRATYQELMDQTDLSKSTLRKRLKKLIDLGHVRKVQDREGEPAEFVAVTES